MTTMWWCFDVLGFRLFLFCMDCSLLQSCSHGTRVITAANRIASLLVQPTLSQQALFPAPNDQSSYDLPNSIFFFLFYISISACQFNINITQLCCLHCIACAEFKVSRSYSALSLS
jgi:hypothetical protein